MKPIGTALKHCDWWGPHDQDNCLKGQRARERRLTERLIAEDPPFENACDAGTCDECREAV